MLKNLVKEFEEGCKLYHQRKEYRATNKVSYNPVHKLKELWDHINYDREDDMIKESNNAQKNQNKN
jgi:hypothetical protein